MSEKKILIGSILLVLTLATYLMYLMIQKDVLASERAKRVLESKEEVLTSWPKVEIEVRK